MFANQAPLVEDLVGEPFITKPVPTIAVLLCKTFPVHFEKTKGE